MVVNFRNSRATGFLASNLAFSDNPFSTADCLTHRGYTTPQAGFSRAARIVVGHEFALPARVSLDEFLDFDRIRLV